MLTLPCCPCQHSSMLIHNSNGSFSVAEDKHTAARRRCVFRAQPWQWSLNSHGSLCWAVPCPAGPGQSPSALVLMLCSSPQGSDRVHGCSSVTGPVHRHYRQNLSAQRTKSSQTHMHIHLTLTPAGLSTWGKVISRSLSGLMRQTNPGWPLPFFLFLFFLWMLTV